MIKLVSTEYLRDELYKLIYEKNIKNKILIPIHAYVALKLLY